MIDVVDQLQPDPITPAPIRLRVTDQPRPEIRIGPGDGTDITPALDRIHIELGPVGCWVTMTLRADLDFEFPVDKVSAAGDPLEDVTATDLTNAIACAGMATPPGEAVMHYLRSVIG